MRPSILLAAFTVLIFASCTTAYKTGQTPDDLYYSPARPQEEFVKKEEKENKEESAYQESENNYLRMKVRDRYRWNDLDDNYYYSSRYSYSSYNCCCYTNPWTPSAYWNNYYNPYNHHYIIPDIKTTMVYNKPRTFNLNAYNPNNTSTNVSNTKYNSAGNNSGNSNTYSAPRNQPVKQDNSGNLLRDIFRGSNSSSSSNSSNSSTNNNSSSSSSSSSGSSSGSSGSTAPVRKF